jgi:hypothetical protein
MPLAAAAVLLAPSYGTFASTAEACGMSRVCCVRADLEMQFLGGYRYLLPVAHTAHWDNQQRTYRWHWRPGF